MQSLKRFQTFKLLLSLSLISTASLVLSGCATTIKEEDFYTDAGADGAIITHLFSTQSTIIGKVAWDGMREGMTCEFPQAFGDLKSELEQLCTRVSCDQGSGSSEKIDTASIQKQVKQMRDTYETFYSRLTSP